MTPFHCPFLGAAKEAPIVTPLMEYVRQKRAIGSGTQVMSLEVIFMFVSVCGY